jgi:hypothetical protein
MKGYAIAILGCRFVAKNKDVVPLRQTRWKCEMNAGPPNDAAA